MSEPVIGSGSSAPDRWAAELADARALLFGERPLDIESSLPFDVALVRLQGLKKDAASDSGPRLLVSVERAPDSPNAADVSIVPRTIGEEPGFNGRLVGTPSGSRLQGHFAISKTTALGFLSTPVWVPVLSAWLAPESELGDFAWLAVFSAPFGVATWAYLTRISVRSFCTYVSRLITWRLGEKWVSGFNS